MNNSQASFQLPPSHEGEPRGRGDDREHDYFNSRPRMRANLHRIGVILFIMDFNSRPRMRANLESLKPVQRETLFQLPPSHEGERGRLIQFSGADHFNSRPRMRANRIASLPLVSYHISTPALA